MTSTATNQITGFSGSLAIKQPVRLATTVPVTLEGLIVIDGVQSVDGDRILVKDQADASQNGIYIASSGLWSRAVDFDATGKVAKGTMTLVGDGPQVGLWMVTAADPVVLGLSDVSFGKAIGPEDLAALIGMGDDEAFAGTAMLTARREDGSLIKRSWANTLVAIASSISPPALGAMISGAIAKATPVDADLLGMADSADGDASKKTTFLQVWANYFKGKADALYQPVKTILTTLGNLANAAGVLTNNGAGALSWGAAGGWDMSGQTVQTPTRSANNTSYQNTTGQPIVVYTVISYAGTSQNTPQLSADNSTWVSIAQSTPSSTYTFMFIVPPNYYYRIHQGTSGSVLVWKETR